MLICASLFVSLLRWRFLSSPPSGLVQAATGAANGRFVAAGAAAGASNRDRKLFIKARISWCVLGRQCITNKHCGSPDIT